MKAANLSKSNEFVNFVIEQMALAGKPTVQAMFGGYGLYLDSTIFAIIVADRLYFKADTKSRGDFLDLGLQPFTYESNGKTVSMSYFEAPSEVYDDPEAMLTWTRNGILKALAAYRTSHINRFGDYTLDMERGIEPIDFDFRFNDKKACT